MSYPKVFRCRDDDCLSAPIIDGKINWKARKMFCNCEKKGNFYKEIPWYVTLTYKTMKLEQIKETSCRICGASPVSETKINRHTNGLWNEERKFACGRIISFCPNFPNKGVYEIESCSKDFAIIKKKQDQREAITKLVKYISRLKVDNKFKQELLAYFPLKNT